MKIRDKKKTQNNKNCPNKLNQEEIWVELILQRTNLEQTPLNHSQQQQQHRTNDLLTESSKTNYEIMTGQQTN